MKINQKTRIIGKKVILVPYQEHHVLKYHKWMQDPTLQELTRSEPLSLEDEYAMQISWREDNDKCTFIVLNREVYNNTNNEIDAMIGDTNIFFTDPNNLREAEIEIMIAEVTNRGKGCGKEATLLMLIYGIEKLQIQKYQVKIDDTNEKSINMFMGLGFQKVGQSNIFKEFTLSKKVNKEWLDHLKSLTLDAVIDENYH